MWNVDWPYQSMRLINWSIICIPGPHAKKVMKKEKEKRVTETIRWILWENWAENMSTVWAGRWCAAKAKETTGRGVGACGRVFLHLGFLLDGEVADLVILLHQPFVHLSDPLHILVGLTGGAVAAAAHRAYRSATGRRRSSRPLILVQCRRCNRVQGFGCDAVEGESTQEVRHVAHVHLRELLHVLSQVVALHLRSRGRHWRVVSSQWERSANPAHTASDHLPSLCIQTC